MNPAELPADGPASSALFEQLAHRWEEAGFVTRDDLRPALSDALIDATSESLGFSPSAELRSWWSWTAGLSAAAHDRLGGYFSFGGGELSQRPLETAVADTLSARAWLAGLSAADTRELDVLRTNRWMVVAKPEWPGYLIGLDDPDRDRPVYGLVDLEDASITWRHHRTLGGMLAAVLLLIERGTVTFDPEDQLWTYDHSAFTSGAERFDWLL